MSMNEKELLKMIKSKSIEELKSTIGPGNLLEFLNIISGSFQNAVQLNRSIDYIDTRNHNYLHELNKEDTGELSKYFNKRLGLQGLFLIYDKAYKLLEGNTDMDSKEVISKMCDILKGSKYYSLEGESTMYDVLVRCSSDANNELTPLNSLANYTGEPVFKTEEDFENKVLSKIRKLIKSNAVLDDYCREQALTHHVVDLYCSIYHEDIRINKSLMLSALEFFYSRNSLFKENRFIFDYIAYLSKIFHGMTCTSTMPPLNYMYAKQAGAAFGDLLKTQDCNGFEKTVTDLENVAFGDISDIGTILHVATLSGEVDIINCALKQVKDINIKNKHGQTSLDIAVSHGQVRTAGFLIKKGANLWLKNEKGKTTFDYCNDEQKTYIVQCLQEKARDKGLFFGCTTGTLGVLIALALFATQVFMINAVAVVTAAASVAVISSVVGSTVYLFSKPNSEMNKLQNKSVVYSQDEENMLNPAS